MILSLFRKDPLPSHYAHPLAGNIPIRINHRATRLTLKFDQHKGFSITAATKSTWSDVQAFIKTYDHWIIKQHSKITPVNLNQIFFQGQLYQIKREAISGRSLYHFNHTDRILTIDPSLSQKRLNIRFILEREVKKILPPVLDKITAAMNLRPKKITLRDTKSRWGSCSSEGNISLSWRLMMAPPEVMEYVVIHEFAHLVHMNHSKSFWQLVARHCPEYRRHIHWLKANGAQIMSID
ncbi:MAG: M48 family metallopeptidase [Candidatus Paracaedibacteraceae bacterium]|nr:M48 family metallopeptidase [Candidatus Paracaedibacteraceae bacterium]